MTIWERLKDFYIRFTDPEREFRELHSRTRERALQAILQKRNRQQIVDYCRKKIKRIETKLSSINSDESDLLKSLQAKLQETHQMLADAKERYQESERFVEIVKQEIRAEEEVIRKKCGLPELKETEYTRKAKEDALRNVRDSR